MIKINNILIDGTLSRDVAYNISDYPYDDIAKTTIKSRKTDFEKSNIYYFTEFATFDIETTNIIDNEELKKSYGFMYHWQACVGEHVIFGRYWSEFFVFFDKIISLLHTDKNHRFVIYVHNLAFEWQFMRDFMYKRYGDIKCFYMDKHVPLVVRLENGLEFRCSYKLSNKSLYKYTKDSGARYVKRIGKLDYSILRYPNTSLNNDELSYNFCDVRGLHESIEKEFDGVYNIANIPLTSTGFVRRDTLRFFNAYDDYINQYTVYGDYGQYFKKLPDFLHKKPNKDYHFRDDLKHAKLDAEVYDLLTKARRGGNTHASVRYAGREVKRVYSYDRVSSYPTVILTRKYPMGKFIKYVPRDLITFEQYMCDDKKCTIAEIYMENVKIKQGNVLPYIPISKCLSSKGARLDNGRVYQADGIQLAVTEIDYKIIRNTYDFDLVAFDKVYRANSDYLPLPVRAVILKYFADKCKLKDKDLYNYLKSKNKLNAVFGMMLTAIAHEVYSFDIDTLEWHKDIPDIDKSLSKYYNSKNSCLRYEWGVYVTAWARYELQEAIDYIGRDIVYVDTDSVKFTAQGDRLHDILSWIDIKNKNLTKEAMDMGAYYDVDGKRYILGVWENEAKPSYKGEDINHKYAYNIFKTYGAKKYCYHLSSNNEFKITVAGLSKDNGAKYIKNIHNFKQNTVIPPEFSGRKVAVWTDDTIHNLTLNDVTFETASSLALADTTYNLNTKDDYRILMFKGQLILT